MTIEERKTEARRNYKARRETWKQDPTTDNWRRFCNAKRECMMLGVRI